MYFFEMSYAKKNVSLMSYVILTKISQLFSEFVVLSSVALFIPS